MQRKLITLLQIEYLYANAPKSLYCIYYINIRQHCFHWGADGKNTILNSITVENMLNLIHQFRKTHSSQLTKKRNIWHTRALCNEIPNLVMYLFLSDSVVNSLFN